MKTKKKNNILSALIRSDKSYKKFSLFDLLIDFAIATFIILILFLPLFKVSYVQTEEDISTMIAPNTTFSLYDEFMVAINKQDAAIKSYYSIRMLPLLCVFIISALLSVTYIVTGIIKLVMHLRKNNVVFDNQIIKYENKMSTRSLAQLVYYGVVLVIIIATRSLVKDIFVRFCLTDKESEFANYFANDYFINFNKLSILGTIFSFIFLGFIILQAYVETVNKSLINKKDMIDKLDDFKNIVIAHKEKYPELQIEDLVKLAYQNEFGNSHMLNNIDNAKQALIKEIDKLQTKDYTEYEDVGNGYVRVYLSSLESHGLDIDKLFEIMLQSADNKKCDTKGLILKLNTIEDMLDKLGLDVNKSKVFIDKYIKDGCPIISHSDVYKENYKPSYRVVKKEVL